MSFYTSLSGLQASQTEMSTISHNLANVSTNGFKRSRTEFADVMASSVSMSPTKMIGSGTVVKAIRQQFSQGGSMQSTNALDMMISGEGFFAVKPNLNSAKVSFTRNGGFGVNADRYVTDSSGGFLQVLPVDEEGKVTASGLTSTRALQLPLSTGQPRATSKIDISVTLPQAAGLPAENSKFNDDNPYAFNRFDPDTYTQSTATTVYGKDGAPLPATLYFTRTSLPTGSPEQSTWEARLYVGNTQVDAVQDDDTFAPLELTFDENGALVSPDGEVQFGNEDAPLMADIKFGSTTRQANSTFALTSLSQDGFAAGKLDNVTVSSDGLVVASFSNGSTQALGKMVLANFPNPAGLRQLGDAHWSVSGDSGEAIVGEANTDGFGAINAGSLERSNVDITEELVALIGAQRNFQANAKAIETATTLTQTITNLRT
jgi:flagellar hook protein FlgE